jgi:hypothetical protein
MRFMIVHRAPDCAPQYLEAYEHDDSLRDKGVEWGRFKREAVKFDMEAEAYDMLQSLPVDHSHLCVERYS